MHIPQQTSSREEKRQKNAADGTKQGVGGGAVFQREQYTKLCCALQECPRFRV